MRSDDCIEIQRGHLMVDSGTRSRARVISRSDVIRIIRITGELLGQLEDFLATIHELLWAMRI